jgi:hypothetical protein
MVSDNDVFVGHDEEVTYEPKDEMHVCWSTPSAVAERGVALGEAPKKKKNRLRILPATLARWISSRQTSATASGPPLMG